MTPVPARPLRSRLYVPGNRAAWMEKALGYGADALILDLEDAVPPAEKAAARTAVSAVLADHGDLHTLFVRVGEPRSDDLSADLAAVVGSGLYGVVVPKVESADELVSVDQALAALERDRGLDVGSTWITPILETARGLRDANVIAESSARLAYLGALSAKGGDVERALGYRWTPEGTETLVVRSQVLLAARAAGVPNPMTGLWTDIDDLTGLAAFAEHSRGLGYEGMDVIHPSHIEPVHRAFTPTEDELEYHRGLVEAMDEAERTGSAAVAYRGQMVDIAMAVTSRAILERAARSL